MNIEGDVFGKIYEYCLGKFAMAEGQRGGELCTRTSIVRLAIEDVLYERLPDTYTGELCDQKRDDIYHHVYTSYSGAGQSIYVAA